MLFRGESESLCSVAHPGLADRRSSGRRGALRGLFVLAVAFCVILVGSGRGLAATKSVVLEWDASPSPSAIGYALYMGTAPGEYFDVLDMAYGTAAFIPDLIPGVTYYFWVTAYNEDVIESDPSNELAYEVPVDRIGPALDPLSDMSLNEDLGVQVVTLTGLSPGIGATNLTITAASGNPSLIPHPTVTGYSAGLGTAQLRFTPASNAYGSVSITVAVHNEHAQNNFLARSFTVNLTPVNDAPTLAPLNDLVLALSSGSNSIPLSGIGSGAANESQSLTVTASSSNPAFVPHPQVIYYSPGTTGSIQLRPATNQYGSAVISVTVSDGQAANATMTRAFTVSVPAPPPAAMTYYMEAEAGVVVAPMAIVTSANASNGRYVTAQSADYGTVTFRVTNALASDFILWCRILSPNSSRDSFYVSVDGGTESIYRTANNIWSTDWQWTRVNRDADAEELVFSLAAGVHTFRFRSREASTSMDAIYVTNNREFVPVRLNVARQNPPELATRLSFQTAAGYRYSIETSTDFLNWSTLWSIPTNIPDARMLFVTNTVAANTMRRAYRIRVNP